MEPNAGGWRMLGVNVSAYATMTYLVKQCGAAETHFLKNHLSRAWSRDGQASTSPRGSWLEGVCRVSHMSHTWGLRTHWRSDDERGGKRNEEKRIGTRGSRENRRLTVKCARRDLHLSAAHGERESHFPATTRYDDYYSGAVDSYSYSYSNATQHLHDRHD